MTVWRVRRVLASCFHAAICIAALWIATVSASGASAVVGKGNPLLTMVVPGGVGLGGPVSAGATLAGGADPTGTIVFRLYGPDDASCAGMAVFTSAVRVLGNRTYDSGPFTPTTAGTYRWRADYSGDANNTPASTPCDTPDTSVVVGKASPSVTVRVSGGKVGDPVRARATLAEGADPTGTIVFRLYGPDDASCAGAAVFMSTVRVSGNRAYDPLPYTPTTAGTYRWRTDYSGDANNTPASTPCNTRDGLIVVGKASPSVAVTVAMADGVRLGDPVRAIATLAGGTNATGTIAFRLYGPDDASCTGVAVFTSMVNVSGSEVHESRSFSPTAAGTYRWTADYSGDANNIAASAPCNTPGTSVMLGKASPSVVLAERVGSSGPVSAGATLTGGTNPMGTITFRLYGPNDASCTGMAVFTSTVGVSGNHIYDSDSFTPTAAGTYRWTADYSGDANNTAASAPCNTPGASVKLAKQTPAGLTPYDPAAHSREIVDLQVAVFALLTTLSTSTARRTTPPQGDSENSSDGGEIVTADADNEDRWVDVLDSGAILSLGSPIMRGDRSRTWRWPATRCVDRVSLNLPPRIAPASPLLARVISDASYLRAILGSVWVLFPMVGIWLAVIAVRNVHGAALPPAYALAVALAVVGVFDALAGLVAVVVFMGGVLLLGGLSSAAAARTLLGLASMWFAAPLIAGVMRPLRRAPTMTLAEHWDRLADIVIASLVGAWAVQKILEGLPGLSGLELPIADQAGTAALMVLAALATRMMVETLAAHWYPKRLSQVQPAELPGSGARQYLAAKTLTLAIFLFAAVPYVGFCWQLYVGATLFILPQLLDLWHDHFPNSPILYIVLPHGIVNIVTMLVVGAVLASLVVAHGPHGQELVRESFVLLSLPGFVLSLLNLAGREGPDRELHWRDQFLGGIVLVIGVLLVLEVIKIG